MEQSRYRVLLITVPSKKAGLKLTQGLIHQKLAACVNFVPGLESYYWWKGKVEKAHEVLLLVKTQKVLVQTVIAYVRENHPYELCETIALPVLEGNREYLRWISASTNPPRPLKDLSEKELEKEVGTR